jgi:hypothetical protein
MSGKQSKTKKPLEVEPLPPIEVEKVEEKETQLSMYSLTSHYR